MPASDPWLIRQNTALKLKGYGVSLDVVVGRVRMRATMPPRPIDPPGSDPKQYRISTGLAYPDQASESLQRHRLGPEPFDWTPWLPKGRERKKPQQTEQPDGVSARQAVRLTRQWWGKQRRRGRSAEDIWKVDYDAPLAPLLDISPLLPEHLVALVEATHPAVAHGSELLRPRRPLPEGPTGPMSWCPNCGNLARATAPRVARPSVIC